MVRRGEKIIKPVQLNQIYSFQHHPVKIIKRPKNSAKVKRVASKNIYSDKLNTQTEGMTINSRLHKFNQICHSNPKCKLIRLITRIIAKEQMVLTVDRRKTLVNKINYVSVDADETNSHRQCVFDSS